jgi:hypothetical protein
VLVLGIPVRWSAINHRDLLRPNADTHFESGNTEFLEVFVNRTFDTVLFKLHFRREGRNKAWIAVIAVTDKLLAFRIPSDHSLRTDILQHLNAIVGEFKQRSSKRCFAFIISDVDLAEIHDPAARIGRDVNLRASQKDRADGATIFPVHLKRILARVCFQNVAREIMCRCTSRAEAQRDVEYLGSARLDITARDHQRIASTIGRICRVRYADGTFKIVAAKIECAGPKIRANNGNAIQWISNRWNRKKPPIQGPFRPFEAVPEHARFERAAVRNTRKVQFHQAKGEFAKWL